MLPEGTKTMGALTPGPKDPEEQENDASNLPNPTHGPKTISADVLFLAHRRRAQPTTTGAGDRSWEPG